MDPAASNAGRVYKTIAAEKACLEEGEFPSVRPALHGRRPSAMSTIVDICHDARLRPPPGFGRQAQNSMDAPSRMRSMTRLQDGPKRELAATGTDRCQTVESFT